MSADVRLGDCLDVMRGMGDCSVHAVVTDPPYGLEFMGKEWDGADGFRRSLNPADVGRDNAFGRTSRTSPEYRAGALFQEWCTQWAVECLRVLRPGGFLLAFGGTRTFHRLACAVEDAGFEIRDSIAWLYGSGFPKSRNVGREVTGFEGWGTALKPAFEPVVVARKPLAGSVAGNVQEWGTGALNIDACRVGTTRNVPASHSKTASSVGVVGIGARRTEAELDPNMGRWPANVVLDGTQADALDQQSGNRPSHGVLAAHHARDGSTDGIFGNLGNVAGERGYDDSGGASRFFPTFRYQAKAPTSERPTYVREGAGEGGVIARTVKQCAECGCKTIASGAGGAPACGHDRWEHVPVKTRSDRVAHPTVKPLGLMRWLVRLVTPPGGVVLDPFAGSGATLEACLIEGFDCIAIERDPESLPLIQIRIDRQAGTLPFGEAAG